MSQCSEQTVIDKNVTAVIPCFNATATLRRCLMALQSAQIAPETIIVVDDGSTDDSGSLARACGATVVPMGRRSGPAAARNRGLNVATTRRVLLCDADVVVAPDALEVALASWSRAGEAIAGVQGVYESTYGGRSVAGSYKHMQQLIAIRSLASGVTPILGSSLALIDRGAVLAVGGFPVRIGGASLEDRVLGTRLWADHRPMLLEPQMRGQHLHEYRLLELARSDFARARDEVLFAEDVGLGGVYVSYATRLRFFCWALMLVLLLSAIFRPTMIWAALTLGVGVLVLDMVRVTRAAHGMRLAWVVVSVVDHTAVVLGAIGGFVLQIMSSERHQATAYYDSAL